MSFSSDTPSREFCNHALDLLHGYQRSSNSSDLVFPTSLTFEERKFIHIQAAKLGLKHRSEGNEERNQRQVIVFKPPFPRKRKYSSEEYVSTNTRRKTDNNTLLQDNKQQRSSKAVFSSTPQKTPTKSAPPSLNLTPNKINNINSPKLNIEGPVSPESKGIVELNSKSPSSPPSNGKESPSKMVSTKPATPRIISFKAVKAPLDGPSSPNKSPPTTSQKTPPISHKTSPPISPHSAPSASELTTLSTDVNMTSDPALIQTPTLLLEIPTVGDSNQDALSSSISMLDLANLPSSEPKVTPRIISLSSITKPTKTILKSGIPKLIATSKAKKKLLQSVIKPIETSPNNEFSFDEIPRPRLSHLISQMAPPIESSTPIQPIVAPITPPSTSASPTVLPIPFCTLEQSNVSASPEIEKNDVANGNHVSCGSIEPRTPSPTKETFVNIFLDNLNVLLKQ